MAESKAPASRSKKFMKDLGIYAIGNLGSKLITFLLVPLYTYYITDPADFGYYDICLTIVFCFCPFVGLQVGEGAFRFLLETNVNDRRKAIISFLYRLVLRNSFIIICIGIGCYFVFEIKYLWFIIMFGLAQAYYDITLQVVRGLGETKYFTIAGILNSFAIGVFSVLFIVNLDLGIPGLFYANIGARVLVLLFIDLKLGIISKYFSFKIKDKKLTGELIKYSFPLLPAILIWWVLNSNNVFFIQYFLGLEENGIYAVLAKFTGIMYIISLIFYQTWQQNAIEQYETPERNMFFSKVLNMYVFLLCGLAIFFSFGLRICYPWLVGPDYQESAQYLFFNAIYIIFYALASFYELGYQCAKKTSRILPSFIFVAVIGIGANFLLIKPLGLYGIILSNNLTYLVLLIYRIYDTRKFMRITFNKSNLRVIGLLVIAGVVFYASPSLTVDLFAVAIFALIYLFLCPDIFKGLLIKKLKKL